jgi:hypothetical protein
MSLISLLRRIVVLTFALALPFALLGLAVARLRGLLAMELLLACGLVFVAFHAEKGILKIYRVRAEAPQGVRQSLARVLARLGGEAPRVLSFSDPAPQALVVRSLGSVGSILLSEGLLGALNEEELRELLAASVLRLRGRGIRFQSLCAWLAHWTLELAPSSWVALLFGELRWHEKLGAVGALSFMTTFTAAKFFVGLGRIPRTDAPRRLARLPSASGEVANPGSCILHFSDPWAERALFRL